MKSHTRWIAATRLQVVSTFSLWTHGVYLNSILFLIFISCLLNSTYAQLGNNWKQIASPGSNGRSNGVSFAVEGKGYFGTGYNGGTTYFNDFWEYEPITNVWTQKADFAGIARYGASAFSIGSKGYVGTGVHNTTYLNDFWEFDPVANIWTKKACFGGLVRHNAASFSIGNKGYIGIGLDITTSPWTFYKDFWEYDPDADLWTQKADFGGTARCSAFSFAISSKGYVGTGYDNNFRKDVWEYNPINNTWTQKADFGGTPRWFLVGFSIGSIGYAGTGDDGNFKNDFWEFNPANNAWIKKADFGGALRTSAVGFSLGNKGYIGAGGSYSGQLIDFWEYTPEACNGLTVFADADNDTYGDAANSLFVADCVIPAGYVSANTDCNDANAAVHPGATEICNEIDDNCDGSIDYAPPSGTVLYLPFNGSTNDESGHGHNGIALNTTLATDRFNIPNRAYSFNGTNSRINVSDHPDLRPTSLTLSLWMYYTSPPSGIQVLAAKALCPGTFESFGLWFNGNLNAGWSDGVTWTPLSAQTPSSGQWHMATFTFDDAENQACIFMDGTLTNSVSTTNHLAYDGSPLIVGAELEYCNPSFYFSGKIDEVLLLNYAMNQSEIESLYQSAGYSQECLSCHFPLGLSSSNITSTSAKLDWDNENGAVGYIIRYRISGEKEWTFKTATPSSKKITGLQPGTEYVWSVRNFCTVTAPALTSAWASNQTFTTAPLRLVTPTANALNIYPNPFQQSATITYSVTEDSRAQIALYDLSGKLMKMLLNENASYGSHTLSLRSEGLSQGIYLLKFQINDELIVKKVVIE